MMKVVIDTNLLIGGAYDENSHAWKIIKEVIEGRLEAFATHRTMREKRLLLKRSVKDSEYKVNLEKYFRALQIVRSRKRLDVVGDKEDNKLFESALASGAKYLITSDREVLDVGEYEGTKVVSPDEFWAVYKNDEDSGSAWQSWSKMLLGQ